MRAFYEEALYGRSVIDSAGRVIGALEGLTIDTESWRVEAIRVKLRKEVTKEIGTSHSTFRAARQDVPVDFIRSVSDTLILKGLASSLPTLAPKEAHAP